MTRRIAEPIVIDPQQATAACSGTSRRGWGFGFAPCRRRATVFEKNQPWCVIHAPSRVDARATARDQRWRRAQCIIQKRAERDALELVRTLATRRGQSLPRWMQELLRARRRYCTMLTTSGEVSP